MADISDVNMEGVLPPSDFTELPLGTYLVRVEDSDKKESTKEVFDSEGAKLPPNKYLQFTAKVYGGPNEGDHENINLNLWNTNEMAVNMAKSELKAIQDATQVYSGDSNHYHGKWMIMEKKEYTKKNKEVGTKRIFSAPPAEMLAAFAHVPPVPAKAPQPAAAPAAAAAASAAGSPSALPSWAKKKTA